MAVIAWRADVTRSADRRIWSIAGPSVVASLTGSLVGLVDIWAIGHLASEGLLAGLAVGAFFMTNLYVMFSFFYMSTVGLVAQSAGFHRNRRIAEVTARAVIMAAALGLVIVLLSPMLRAATVGIWSPSPEAAEAAGTYLRIRILSAPAIFISLAVRGFLIGTRRARTSLYLDLILNGLNVVLTAAFVFGLRWGVAGAAIGNLIAEWGAAVGGVLWAGHLIRPARVLAVVRRRVFWRAGSFRQQASINTLLFVRTLFIQAVFATLSASGAHLGDDVLAANHVLLQLIFVATLCLVGMSSATQTLVGEAKGAGSRALFHFWSARTALWSFVVAVSAALAFGIGGAAMVAALTNIGGVRAAAGSQLYFVALWPIVAVWSYQLDGVFIGATSVRPMLWGASLAAALFVAAQWVLVPSLGNTGLWMAFILFFAVRGVVLASCYLSLAADVGPAATT